MNISKQDFAYCLSNSNTDAQVSEQAINEFLSTKLGITAQVFFWTLLTGMGVFISIVDSIKF